MSLSRGLMDPEQVTEKEVETPSHPCWSLEHDLEAKGQLFTV